MAAPGMLSFTEAQIVDMSLPRSSADVRLLVYKKHCFGWYFYPESALDFDLALVPASTRSA